MAYLVMEYINYTSTPGPDLAQRVARALQWLRDLPAPDSVMIGPIGNAPARHTLFKHYVSPLCFSIVEAIERYLNRVRPCFVTFPEHSPSANQVRLGSQLYSGPT